MKTISRGFEKGERVESKKEIEEDDSLLENMVIVAFPGETWAEVGRISDKMGIPNASVLALAIKKLAKENGL
jgi:hypothetical protein